MKKALRQQTHRVHFGEAEDFLATSFFNDGVAQVPDDEKSEEEKKKEEINSRVVQALSADDVSMLKHLQVEIPDLVDTYLDRPLAHLAAEHGALKILQECVSKPADSINAASADFEATTPLFWAIREGHADVVDWLLSNGAFHQPLNVYQDSAVYVAVYYDQTDLLDVLQAHRCDCNIPNRNGDLPLIHAISKSNIKALDKLIEMGVDIYGGNGNKWDITMDTEPDHSPIKQSTLELAYFENIGPLCQAVLSGNFQVTKTVYDHQKRSGHSRPEGSSWQQSQDLLSAMVAAVLSKNLEMIELFIESDISNTMVTFALKEAENNKFEVLRYLIEHKANSGNVLSECIANCRTKAAMYGGYPYCKWDSLFLPCKKIWTMHNLHRKIVRVIAEAGFDTKKVFAGKPSPFMEAISMGLFCLMCDLMRYGSGVSVTRKRDKDVFLNIFYVALLPKNRPSGFRRKSIRAAFILASYPLYYSNDAALERTVKKCLASPGDQNEMLQASVINLANLYLYRIHNVSKLQHLCRIAILTRLKHFGSANASSHLGLPKRLVDYLELKDLLSHDKVLCHQMGRIPDIAKAKPSNIERCPCVPV